MNYHDQLEWRRARLNVVFKLRKQGVSYKDIGDKLGVSEQRARQLFRQSKWWQHFKPHWSDGLNIRIANVLNNRNIRTMEEARQAFLSGALRPGAYACRNYGWGSHKELAKWLGLPEPRRMSVRSANSK